MVMDWVSPPEGLLQLGLMDILKVGHSDPNRHHLKKIIQMTDSSVTNVTYFSKLHPGMYFYNGIATEVKKKKGLKLDYFFVYFDNVF